MDKHILDERKRKVDIIIRLYDERENRQEDVARILNIPISIVRKVTQAYGYEHTKKKISSNLYPGQMMEMGLCYDKMSYLDKYEF